MVAPLAAAVVATVAAESVVPVAEALRVVAAAALYVVVLNLHEWTRSRASARCKLDQDAAII